LQIGNLRFDPEDRLIDCGASRRIDVATFRIDRSEVAKLGKKVVVAGDGPWPEPPNPGEIALHGGFLGTQRLVIGPNEISFGLHLGTTPITDFTEHQIRCRFHRESWVDVRGLGLRRDAKVWLEPEVSLDESYGFNPRELSNILRIVEEYRDLILKAWHDHFGD
jgi:hypothetical protein